MDYVTGAMTCLLQPVVDKGLQFVVRRLLNRFLKSLKQDQFSISLGLDGMYSLRNLEFNTQEVNEVFLAGLPFTMVYGRIGELDVSWRTRNALELTFRVRDVEIALDYVPPSGAGGGAAGGGRGGGRGPEEVKKEDVLARSVFLGDISINDVSELRSDAAAAAASPQRGGGRGGDLGGAGFEGLGDDGDDNDAGDEYCNAVVKDLLDKVIQRIRIAAVNTNISVRFPSANAGTVDVLWLEIPWLEFKDREMPATEKTRQANAGASAAASATLSGSLHCKKEITFQTMLVYVHKDKADYNPYASTMCGTSGDAASSRSRDSDVLLMVHAASKNSVEIAFVGSGGGEMEVKMFLESIHGVLGPMQIAILRRIGDLLVGGGEGTVPVDIKVQTDNTSAAADATSGPRDGVADGAGDVDAAMSITIKVMHVLVALVPGGGAVPQAIWDALLEGVETEIPSEGGRDGRGGSGGRRHGRPSVARLSPVHRLEQSHFLLQVAPYSGGSSGLLVQLKQPSEGALQQTVVYLSVVAVTWRCREPRLFPRHAGGGGGVAARGAGAGPSPRVGGLTGRGKFSSRGRAQQQQQQAAAAAAPSTDSGAASTGGGGGSGGGGGADAPHLVPPILQDDVTTDPERLMIIRKLLTFQSIKNKAAEQLPQIRIIITTSQTNTSAEDEDVSYQSVRIRMHPRIVVYTPLLKDLTEAISGLFAGGAASWPCASSVESLQSCMAQTQTSHLGSPQSTMSFSDFEEAFRSDALPSYRRPNLGRSPPPQYTGPSAGPVGGAQAGRLSPGGGGGGMGRSVTFGQSITHDAEERVGGRGTMRARAGDIPPLVPGRPSGTAHSLAQPAPHVVEVPPATPLSPQIAKPFKQQRDTSIYGRFEAVVYFDYKEDVPLMGPYLTSVLAHHAQGEWLGCALRVRVSDWEARTRTNTVTLPAGYQPPMPRSGSGGGAGGASSQATSPSPPPYAAHRQDVPLPQQQQQQQQQQQPHSAAPTPPPQAGEDDGESVWTMTTGSLKVSLRTAAQGDGVDLSASAVGGRHGQARGAAPQSSGGSTNNLFPKGEEEVVLIALEIPAAERRSARDSTLAGTAAGSSRADNVTITLRPNADAAAAARTSRVPSMLPEDQESAMRAKGAADANVHIALKYPQGTVNLEKHTLLLLQYLINEVVVAATTGDIEYPPPQDLPHPAAGVPLSLLQRNLPFATWNTPTSTTVVTLDCPRVVAHLSAPMCFPADGGKPPYEVPYPGLPPAHRYRMEIDRLAVGCVVLSSFDPWTRLLVEVASVELYDVTERHAAPRPLLRNYHSLYQRSRSTMGDAGVYHSGLRVIFVSSQCSPANPAYPVIYDRQDMKVGVVFNRAIMTHEVRQAANNFILVLAELFSDVEYIAKFGDDDDEEEEPPILTTKGLTTRGAGTRGSSPDDRGDSHMVADRLRATKIEVTGLNVIIDYTPVGQAARVLMFSERIAFACLSVLLSEEFRAEVAIGNTTILLDDGHFKQDLVRYDAEACETSLFGKSLGGMVSDLELLGFISVLETTAGDINITIKTFSPAKGLTPHIKGRGISTRKEAVGEHDIEVEEEVERQKPFVVEVSGGGLRADCCTDSFKLLQDTLVQYLTCDPEEHLRPVVEYYREALGLPPKEPVEVPSADAAKSAAASGPSPAVPGVRRPSDADAGAKADTTSALVQQTAAHIGKALAQALPTNALEDPAEAAARKSGSLYQPMVVREAHYHYRNKGNEVLPAVGESDANEMGMPGVGASPPIAPASPQGTAAPTAAAAVTAAAAAVTAVETTAAPEGASSGSTSPASPKSDRAGAGPGDKLPTTTTPHATPAPPARDAATAAATSLSLRSPPPAALSTAAVGRAGECAEAAHNGSSMLTADTRTVDGSGREARRDSQLDVSGQASLMTVRSDGRRGDMCSTISASLMHSESEVSLHSMMSLPSHLAHTITAAAAAATPHGTQSCVELDLRESVHLTAHPTTPPTVAASTPGAGAVATPATTAGVDTPGKPFALPVYPSETTLGDFLEDGCGAWRRTGFQGSTASLGLLTSPIKAGLRDFGGGGGGDSLRDTVDTVVKMHSPRAAGGGGASQTSADDDGSDDRGVPATTENTGAAGLSMEVAVGAADVGGARASEELTTATSVADDAPPEEDQFVGGSYTGAATAAVGGSAAAWDVATTTDAGAPSPPPKPTAAGHVDPTGAVVVYETGGGGAKHAGPDDAADDDGEDSPSSDPPHLVPQESFEMVDTDTAPPVLKKQGTIYPPARAPLSNMIVEDYFQHIEPKTSRLRSIEQRVRGALPELELVISGLTLQLNMYGGKDFVTSMTPDGVNHKLKGLAPNANPKKTSQLYRTTRVYGQLVTVECSDIFVMVDLFSTFGTEEGELWRVKAGCRKIDILDKLTVSSRNYILRSLTDIDETRDLFMVEVQARVPPSMAGTPEAVKHTELDLAVHSEPLRINVDQDALEFVTQFFKPTPTGVVAVVPQPASRPPPPPYNRHRANTTTNQPQHQTHTPVMDATAETEEGIHLVMQNADGDDHEGRVYFRSVTVSALQIKLDYNAKRCSFEALQNMEALEFLNLLNIEGMLIELAPVAVKGVWSDRLALRLAEQWWEKLPSLSSLLSGVPTVRAVTRIGSAAARVVTHPSTQYRQGRNPFSGLPGAMLEFVQTCAVEAIHLTEQAARLGGGLVNAGVQVLVPEDDDHPLVPADVHPANFQEGLTQAFSRTGDDISATVRVFSQLPQAVRDGYVMLLARSFCLVLLRPVRGLFRGWCAVAQGGMISLDTERRAEHVTLFKPSRGQRGQYEDPSVVSIGEGAMALRRADTYNSSSSG